MDNQQVFDFRQEASKPIRFQNDSSGQGSSPIPSPNHGSVSNAICKTLPTLSHKNNLLPRPSPVPPPNSSGGSNKFVQLKGTQKRTRNFTPSNFPKHK